jgi:hypothetical protein
MGNIAICCLALLLVGCDTLGGRTVTLKPKQVSPPDEVQRVLQLVDDTLAPEGARRVAYPPNEEHRIAYYTGGPFICTVSAEDGGGVMIDIRNPGFGAGRHPTSTVKRVSDTLAEKLGTEYGSKRVKVQ